MPFFINADLEITSTRDLHPLRAGFGERVCENWMGQLGDGNYFACFEINAQAAITSPEPLVVEFCGLIDGLQAEAMDAWTASHRRVMDLGYQTDHGGNCLTDSLSASVMTHLSRLNVELVITVYPLEGSLSSGPASPQSKS